MPENLDLETIISLIEGPVDELEIFVESNDLRESQLETLLKAEKMAGNRREVVEYLRKKLDREESHGNYTQKTIGILKAVQYDGEEPKLVLEIDGIKFELENTPSLSFANHSFRPVHKGEEDHLKGLELLEGSSGTATEGRSSKRRGTTGSGTTTSGRGNDRGNDRGREAGAAENTRTVAENRRSTDELEDDLDRALEQVRKEEKDGEEEEDEELLEEMREIEQEQGTEQLRNELEELGYDREELEEMSLEELRELKKKIEHKKKWLQEELGADPEMVEGKTLEELKYLEKQLEDRRGLVEYLEQYGYTPEELEGRSADELGELLEEMQRKEEILEDIGVEMPMEELKEIDVEELEAIRDEKKEREELIEELQEHGLDEDELRSSSTSDLKMLKRDLSGTSMQEYQNILRQTPQQIQESVNEMDDLDLERLLELEKQGQARAEVLDFLHREIEKMEENYEEEAEEDLEMLMGARNGKEEEKEKKKPTDSIGDRIADFRQQFKDAWDMRTSANSQSKEEAKRDQKVMNLLERYRRLGREESAVKTAQVMKGYLEYKLDIEHEMTYQELVENLGEVADENQNIGTLIDFFESMQRQEYSGNITADMENVIDAAEQTVAELRG